jgi:SprT protein
MQDAILAKVEESFVIAEKFYNRTFERPRNIIFKRSGTTGGHSHYGRRELMFQLDLAEHNQEDFLKRTVPHEVAHYVQRAVYGYSRNGKKVMPHGTEWKYIMRNVYHLNPDRCHTYDTSVTTTRKRARDFKWSCDCKIHNVTSNIHNKMLRGQRRRCITCKGVLRFDSAKTDMDKLQEMLEKLATLQQKTTSNA